MKYKYTTRLRSYIHVFIPVISLGILGGISLHYFYPSSVFLTKNSAQYAALEIKKSCNQVALSSGEPKLSCYSKKFYEITFKEGPIQALEALYALQEIDQDAQKCHFIGHGIGHGIYKRNPDNWQNDVASVSTGCSFGVPMGIIENYTASFLGGEITKEFIPTICGLHSIRECNHTVGHTLLVETKGDIDKASELCSGIQDSLQLYACFTGVFMEHMTAQNLAAHGYAPSASVPWHTRLSEFEKLCRSYGGDKGMACWEMIAHPAVAKFYTEPKSLFDFCGSASRKKETERCLHMAINDMAGVYNFDLSSIQYICKIAQPKPTFEEDCYLYLAETPLTVIPQEAERVVNFCSSLDSQFRNACFSHIGNVLRANSGIKPEQIKELCNLAPADLAEQCSRFITK